MGTPQEAALARLGDGAASCGVAAAVLDDTTPADQDGRTWKVLVTDGLDRAEVIEVATGQPHAAAIDDERVVKAVERRAYSFARDRDGLGSLVASAPLYFRADEIQ